MTLNLIETLTIAICNTKHTQNTKIPFQTSTFFKNQYFSQNGTFISISVFRLFLLHFPQPPGVNNPPLKKPSSLLDWWGLLTPGRGYIYIYIYTYVCTHEYLALSLSNIYIYYLFTLIYLYLSIKSVSSYMVQGGNPRRA